MRRLLRQEERLQVVFRYPENVVLAFRTLFLLTGTLLKRNLDISREVDEKIVKNAEEIGADFHMESMGGIV